MQNAEPHPSREAVEAFATELARLDIATAHAVAAEARELIRAAWLRQQLQNARESGEPLDGDQVFDALLAEADADIAAAAFAQAKT